MAIELVRWQDAHHYLQEPDEFPNDYIVETVGEVEVDGSWLVITQETLPGGDGRRGITRILRDSVVERVRLTSVRGEGAIVDPGGPGGWPPPAYGVEDTID